MTGAVGMAVGVAGGAVLVIAAIDLFITVFNYDGFNFLASRLHGLLWAVVRTSSRPLPQTKRAGYLSVGSAGMLPFTLLWWLGLEVTGFALMYLPGLASGEFAAQNRTLLGAGGAFYLSAGDLTSLTFGDLVARSAVYRALLDLETVIGLATFTIGLTYVIAAFEALGTLNRLHGRVRRHAISPNQPASILARHFLRGRAEGISSLVQSLVEDLASYEDALRRYPVVFYFHTRQAERSIPMIYAALGQLIELLRFGLPRSEDITQDPYVLALEDQYTITGERLLRSFVGPPPASAEQQIAPHRFAAAYAAHQGSGVRAFASLRAEAAEATGLTLSDDPASPELYQQYVEWETFHTRRDAVEQRLRRALCYDEQAAVERPG